MRNYNDYIGQKFGRWTIIGLERFKRKGARYLCICDCGVKKSIRASTIHSKESKSCGCLRMELNIERDTTHGMTKSTEYRSWASMKDRCTNPNNPAYMNYGGRGITVCDRWLNSFENFLLDMGQKPTKKHSIDRINVDKGYSPENCQWASSQRQSRNKRNAVKIEYDGQCLSIPDWSDITGLTYCCILQRYERGWSPDKILTMPAGKNYGRPIVDNETGIKYSSVRKCAADKKISAWKVVNDMKYGKYSYIPKER